MWFIFLFLYCSILKKASVSEDRLLLGIMVMICKGRDPYELFAT